MIRLAPRLIDKPWGRTGIDPRFGADPARQIGEVWFEQPYGRTSDILAKYLFTTERLSIQVHPTRPSPTRAAYRMARTNAGSSSMLNPGPKSASVRLRRLVPRRCSMPPATGASRR